jgi:large subunit ribosomal protein L24
MAHRLRVGDVVVVTAGKDKGRRGRVLKILEAKDRVIVEGVNKVTRHLRKNPQNPSEGGRTEKEASIHVSNVMPWSDKDGKGVRVRIGEEKGKKVRVSAASGAVLTAAPITAGGEEAEDKKNKDGDD